MLRTTFLTITYLLLLGSTLYLSKEKNDLEEINNNLEVENTTQLNLILTYDLLTIRQNNIIDMYQSSRNAKLADSRTIELMYEISEKCSQEKDK